MDSRDLDELVSAWSRYQLATADDDDTGTEEHEDFSSVLSVSRLVRTEPATALQFIEKAFKVNADDRVLAVLAAGPLEDLLAEHGATVIDTVERMANSDERFRELLCGVWRNVIDPKTWERLERIRAAR